MQRTIMRLCVAPPVRRRAAAPRGLWERELKQVKEEQIASSREAIFGVQGNMPGDRHFQKPLEGRDFQNWYFASKFNFQNFRVDEYLEMQAERFDERETHSCIPDFEEMLGKVGGPRREELRAFFGQLDEATFVANPSLQDLYGLFRLVDPDPALGFELTEAHERLFREHGVRHVLPKHSPLGADDCPVNPEQLVLEENSAAKRAGLSAGFQVHLSQGEAGGTKPATVRFPGPAHAGLGGSAGRRTFAKDEARKRLEKLHRNGEDVEEELKTLGLASPSAEARERGVRAYIARRHRFADPMFRRRRLKWLERQMAEKNNETEVKFNSYFATHPDDHKEWPSNKGSVTVIWPSPYH